jgi:hypothetical protein
MAAGAATLANLPNTLAEVYTKPFASLKDTGKKRWISRIPTKKARKATVDFKVRDAAYSPMWSASESDQLSFITSTVWASDGVGTATAFLAPNNHPFVNASVTIRLMYAAVEVSALAQAVNSDALWVADVLSDEMDQATMDFWRAVNIRALSTATTSGNSGKDPDGLGVMFNGTTYAGLAVASFPAWVPVIDSTTTVLTVGALQTMYNNIVGGTQVLGPDTIREGDVSEIWTSPQQWTAYGNLLTGFRRYGADDTLDAGIGEALNFNNVPLMMFPRFPAGYLVMYSGGLEYDVLQALKTSEKSQNKVDATAVVLGHFANFVLRDRKNQGIFTALT